MQVGAIILSDMWVLILVAVVGTLFRLTEKWMAAKTKNPNIVFDYVYVKYAMISILGMVWLFSQINIPVSIESGFLALFSGYSGQQLATKGVQSQLTPKEPIFNVKEVDDE